MMVVSIIVIMVVVVAVIVAVVLIGICWYELWLLLVLLSKVKQTIVLPSCTL